LALELAAVDQTLIDRILEQKDVEQESDLGILSALTIKRYARAVGETNPVYLDSRYARALGFGDIISPPNLPVSVMDWTEGSPNDELRQDGTEPGVTLPGVPSSGYRLMGGGEDMTFIKPIVAGQHLTLTVALSEATLRDSRSGPMAVVKLRRRYFADGDLALEAIQTILVR